MDNMMLIKHIRVSDVTPPHTQLNSVIDYNLLLMIIGVFLVILMICLSVFVCHILHVDL